MLARLRDARNHTKRHQRTHARQFLKDIEAFISLDHQRHKWKGLMLVHMLLLEAKYYAYPTSKKPYKQKWGKFMAEPKDKILNSSLVESVI